MEDNGLPPGEFERLVQKYRASIPSKLQEIQQALEELEKNKTKEDLQNLRMLVHKIAGNAGTFGYGRVSELCRGMDVALSQMLKGDLALQLHPKFFSDFKAFFTHMKNEFQNPS